MFVFLYISNCMFCEFYDDGDEDDNDDDDNVSLWLDVIS